METAPTHETPIGSQLLDIFELGDFATEPLKRRDGSIMLRNDGEPMTAADYPEYTDPLIKSFISIFVEKHRAGTATQDEYDAMLATTTGYMGLIRDEHGSWIKASDAIGSS